MQCERKLKLCHATALVLSGWLLMTPTPVKDTLVVDVTGAIFSVERIGRES